ncbi:MAG: thiamine phosphate synthase [bacterium]
MIERPDPHDWGLYVIADADLASPASYPEIARQVFQGGARVLQLRDKKTPFEELVKTGRLLRALADEYGAALIVNDNPYLAREIDADGVHLGQEDTPVEIAREIVGPEKLIGLSTHNAFQAIQAQSLEVDYIGLGPIYATKTKKQPHPPLGGKVVRWAARDLRVPFVCIGGINLQNLEPLLEAGAMNFAVISAIMSSGDIEGSTRSLVEAIQRHRATKV